MKSIMRSWSVVIASLLWINLPLQAQDLQVEQWGLYELSLPGPTAGNPFVGITFKVVFKQGDQQFEPQGFYDGNGRFKIRFMPNRTGVWTYHTISNVDALNGHTGRFQCIAPSPSNHGPVRIKNQYHFAYADGTPFFSFGTTIYEWPFQSEAKQQQTLESLKSAPFNKARFLVIPPYRPEYNKGPHALHDFPFVGPSKETWDFSRFNPAYFRHLETCVKQLQEMGIEADLILFRPYDHGKWGFDTMDMATNDRYLRYVVARFAAYHNVWWSLANENSYIKNLNDADWDHLFKVVQANDPYGHLRSIHNADRLYDYKKPWVTHVSLQYYMAVRFFGYSPLLREIYGKPIIYDEINYEGNIASRWGQLSGQEMTYRFWIATLGGAYATHGATHAGEDMGDGWISTGGELTGQSPPRIAFLKRIVEQGPLTGLDPIDHNFETNIAGQTGRYYLIYFGKQPIKTWPFILPEDGLKPGMQFKVDVFDTWNMTITPVQKTFTVKRMNRYKFIDTRQQAITLPGQPYLALRIQRLEK